MSEPQIVVEPEATNAFRFTFRTEEGEISGHTVGDQAAGYTLRSEDEKRRAAKQRIKELCEEIAQASEEERYADRG